MGIEQARKEGHLIDKDNMPSLNKLRYIVDTSQVLESWKDLDRIKGNWEENESKIHP
jgi:hypothetical protein